MISFQVSGIYIIVSLLIGVIGRHRKLGFWGYFFGALLLTPLMGILLLIASDKKRPEQRLHR